MSSCAPGARASGLGGLSSRGYWYVVSHFGGGHPTSGPAGWNDYSSSAEGSAWGRGAGVSCRTRAPGVGPPYSVLQPRPRPHLSRHLRRSQKADALFLVKFQQKVYASLNMEIQNFISNLLDLN